MDEVRDISSPIGAFVRERIVLEAGRRIDVADLFAEWCRWCDAKKRKSGEESIFGRNLRSVLPAIETKQRRGDRSLGEKTMVRYFEGIAIRGDDDFQSECSAV